MYTDFIGEATLDNTTKLLRDPAVIQIIWSGVFVKKDQKEKQTPLLTLNNFILQDSDVFIRRQAEGLLYSDGDAEEQYIYQAVSSAHDVSSLSEELRTFERDWSSECHLSSKRANVFRALNFSGVRCVLEIGSGCGAITRFLGEQGGRVDAVEGSLRRAEITRMRCRDLNNVTVVHADFNTLQLPESYYDLAVLTGVLEYAGKYGKPGEDPHDAAVAMLKRIIRCLRPGGTVVIAIENRIGFKYLAGACEDHFSLPWVGLSNYPDCNDSKCKEKQGIRTWDKSQWQDILKRLQGVRCQWYYPFPDYKLATSLLSEEFIRSTPSAWSCLSRVRSRDYTATWHPFIDEQLFWQAAASAKALEEMANSFVLVLQRGRSPAPANDLIPFDFVHFTSHNRKPEYRVMVEKKKGEREVEKKALFLQCGDARNIVVQHLEKEPFYEGELLAVHWADVLRFCTSPATFSDLLLTYYTYVVQECERTVSGKLLDLLPFNIVVADDGRWHPFDQEWQMGEEVSSQFIFFRAVLFFYHENKEILQAFCKDQSLKNGWDFVRFCLQSTLPSGEYDLQEFVELENAIQKAINRPETLDSIESVLESTPGRVRTWSWEKIFLVWGECGIITPPVSSSCTNHGLNIIFSLPREVCTSPFIQLSLGIPEYQVGLVFIVRSFTLYGYCSDGSRKQILPMDPDQVIPPLMQLTGLIYCPEIKKGVFIVDDKEPQVLHFLFPEVENSNTFSKVECEVELEFSGETGTQEMAVLFNEKQRQLAEIEQSRAWQAVLKLRKIKEKVADLLSGIVPFRQ